MHAAPIRTISEWRSQGYRGLRIPRCPECLTATSTTWEHLRAEPGEDSVDVARRVRCENCEQAPAGLAVLTYREAA